MKKVLFFLLAIVVLGCVSENDGPEKTALKLITGLTLRQNFDDTPFQLGNPNTLTADKFVIYPNPANETFVVFADENVSNVWVVPANPQKIYQDVDFSTVLNNDLYSEQTLASNSDSWLSGQTSNTVSMDISDLEPGYYKVFVKIGGEIYWDNLYKYDEQLNDEAPFNALADFWD